jgi:toxin secretion/phage lysis holin
MEISTRTGILSIFGIIGSFIANLIGGFDTAMYTLFVFMVVDYISGMVVAGVFQKSGKSKCGGLESGVGFKGLLRKGMIMVMVLVAYKLDTILGYDFIRNATIIAYIVNEAISILENAGIMGIPIPDKLKRSIEVLKHKND